jgi:hypothetical protein
VKSVAGLYQHERLGASGQRLLLGMLLVTPLVMLAAGWRRWNYRNPRDLGMLAMPAYAWIGGLGGFVLREIDRASWPLSLIRLVMVILGGVGLYLLPYAETLRRPKTS